MMFMWGLIVGILAGVFGQYYRSNLGMKIDHSPEKYSKEWWGDLMSRTLQREMKGGIDE
jgi:hypothetical protein